VTPEVTRLQAAQTQAAVTGLKTDAAVNAGADVKPNQGNETR